MDSILNTIKKLLGLPEDVTAFDFDIRVAINTAIANLVQMGVGPKEGFRINGTNEEWWQFIGDDPRLSAATEYIFMYTKLAFDPPQSSIVQASYERMIKELEWRLNIQVETPDDEAEEEGGEENQNDTVQRDPESEDSSAVS